MARIRTVKPDFFGSPKTAKVSIPARLLMLGLLTEADDDGKLLGSPKRVAGAVFPNDDEVTPSRVQKWLEELEAATFIRRYSVDGVDYIIVPGFEEHQRISHPTPSKLPSPSGEVPELFAPSRTREEQGTGNREQGGGKSRGSRIPDEFVVEPPMILWVEAEFPRLNWRSETAKFVDHFKSVAGSKGVKADWERTWKVWMRRAQDGMR